MKEYFNDIIYRYHINIWNDILDWIYLRHNEQFIILEDIGKNQHLNDEEKCVLLYVGKYPMVSIFYLQGENEIVIKKVRYVFNI